MKRMFYYAKLNKDNVCIGVESRIDKLDNVDGYLEMNEYNEVYLYRKWENNQWSSETYEPNISTELQNKVADFEVKVTEQNSAISDLTQSNTSLISQIELLQGTIMELTQLMATMQGGM